MAIIVNTSLSDKMFSTGLKEFSFSIGGDSATVTIFAVSGNVLSELYYPVSGTITLYEVGDLIQERLRSALNGLVTISVIEHDNGSDTDSYTKSMTVYYSDADTPGDADTYIDSHFLTPNTGTRLTAIGRKELLYAEGTDSDTGSLTLEYLNLTTNEIEIETKTHNSLTVTNGVHCFSIVPSDYVKDGYTLFAFTQTSGSRSQRYEVDMSAPVVDPIIYYVNSFGLIDVFYLTGTRKDSLDITRKSGYVKGMMRNYYREEVKNTTADTGILPFDMAVLAEDLIRSPETYEKWNSGRKAITITEHKAEKTNVPDDLKEYTITYRRETRKQNELAGSGSATAWGIFDNTFDISFN